jgi:hypothetical protein
MLEIIVVTRMGGSEFTEKLFPNKASPIEQTTPDKSRRLRIFDGAAFPDKGVEQVANKIGALVPVDCEEALFILHSTNFEAIKNSLEWLSDGREWTVRQYSGTFDNYADTVVPSFQAAEYDPDQVNLIYELFGPDKLLEEILTLLHRCLLPANIPDQFPKPLDKEKYAVDAWTKFLDPGHDNVDVRTLDAFDTSFIDRLTDLRDSLLDRRST